MYVLMPYYSFQHLMGSVIWHYRVTNFLIARPYDTFCWPFYISEVYIGLDYHKMVVVGLQPLPYTIVQRLSNIVFVDASFDEWKDVSIIIIFGTVLTNFDIPMWRRLVVEAKSYWKACTLVWLGILLVSYRKFSLKPWYCFERFDNQADVLYGKKKYNFSLMFLDLWMQKLYTLGWLLHLFPLFSLGFRAYIYFFFLIQMLELKNFCDK